MSPANGLTTTTPPVCGTIPQRQRKQRRTLSKIFLAQCVVFALILSLNGSLAFDEDSLHDSDSITDDKINFPKKDTPLDGGTEKNDAYGSTIERNPNFVPVQHAKMTKRRRKTTKKRVRRTDSSSRHFLDSDDDFGEKEAARSSDDDHFSDSDSESDYSSDDEDEVLPFMQNKFMQNKKNFVLKQMKRLDLSPAGAMELWKQNKSFFFVAVVLFAFRREIISVVTYHLARHRPTPTGLIKIILFLNFLRRMNILPLGGPQSDNEFGGRNKEGYGEGKTNGATKRFGLMNLIEQTLSGKVMHVFNPPVAQHFMFERVNDRYAKDRFAMMKIMGEISQISSTSNITSNTTAASNITSAPGDETNTQPPRTIVVLQLKGDVTLTQLPDLRDSVSFLLSQPRTSQLEILLLLESPGGSASDYGLGSEILSRIRKQDKVTLTVCVDKVAASGGYMMACQASPGQLLASPFSVVGSIGVLGQAINIDNALRSYGIQPLVFKAGTHKAPLGMIGEVTKEGMAKVQQTLEDTHLAFKALVSQARPELDIGKVATGDVWLGVNALDVGLVDRIITSDEYIAERMQAGDTVLKMLKYDRAHTMFWGANRLFPLSPFAAATRGAAGTLADLRRVLTKVTNVIDLEGKGMIQLAGGDSDIGSAVKAFDGHATASLALATEGSY